MDGLCKLLNLNNLSHVKLLGKRCLLRLLPWLEDLAPFWLIPKLEFLLPS
jgi:hypothetical protein